MPVLLLPGRTVMVPLLLIRPRNDVTFSTPMPAWNPETLPALLISPEKVTGLWTKIPKKRLPFEITPEALLTMPPEKVGALTKTAPLRLPLLRIPPVNVSPPIEITLLAPVITLWLSIVMPPRMVPVEAITPVMVPLVNVMPPGEIVPSLVMLPVKLVWVTATQAVVWRAGLSKPLPLPAPLAHRASAGDVPPPMSNADTELDASNRSKLRPRTSPSPKSLRAPAPRAGKIYPSTRAWTTRRASGGRLCARFATAKRSILVDRCEKTTAIWGEFKVYHAPRPVARMERKRNPGGSIPGLRRGACHRAALRADPLAPPSGLRISRQQQSGSRERRQHRRRGRRAPRERSRDRVRVAAALEQRQRGTRGLAEDDALVAQVGGRSRAARRIGAGERTRERPRAHLRGGPHRLVARRR